MRKNDIKDDDGRVIADMSGVEKPIMFGFLSPSFRRSRGNRFQGRSSLEDGVEMSREERRYYILGALKASLLIGLAYAVGLGLIILLMVLLWAR